MNLIHMLCKIKKLLTKLYHLDLIVEFLIFLKIYKLQYIGLWIYLSIIVSSCYMDIIFYRKTLDTPREEPSNPSTS